MSLRSRQASAPPGGPRSHRGRVDRSAARHASLAQPGGEAGKEATFLAGDAAAVDQDRRARLSSGVMSVAARCRPSSVRKVVVEPSQGMQAPIVSGLCSMLPAIRGVAPRLSRWYPAASPLRLSGSFTGCLIQRCYRVGPRGMFLRVPTDGRGMVWLGVGCLVRACQAGPFRVTGEAELCELGRGPWPGLGRSTGVVVL